MSGCKIGKIKMKNGAEIIPIKNTNLTLHSSGMHWTALKKANELVHKGSASMVAVVVIHDNGKEVYADWSMKYNVTTLDVVGPVQLLADDCMKWAKK